MEETFLPLIRQFLMAVAMIILTKYSKLIFCVCVCRFVYESRQQNKFLMTCPLKLYHSFGKPKNQRKEEI